MSSQSPTHARPSRHLLRRASTRLRDAVEPGSPRAAPGEPRFRLLFVCRGNICRSSLAHGFLRAELARSGLLGPVVVESAGTSGWNAGKRPHWRARACARRRGFTIGDLRARQVTADDFDRFDLLVVMDSENREALGLLARTPDDMRRVIDLAAHDIADPVHGDDDDFDTAYREIESGCRRLLDQILETGAAS